MVRLSRRRLGWTAMVACTVLACGRVTADEAKAPDDVMKDKGLVKVANQYLLEADAKLPEALKEFRAIQKKNDDDSKKRAQLESTIRGAKGQMGSWDLEYRQLNEKLGSVTDTFQHNQIVGKINALVSKLKEGQTWIAEREGELAKMGSTRDEYVNALLALSEKFDTMGKQYEALKNDKDVKDALTAINDKARPKMALGPSAVYTQNAFQIKKQRDGIRTDVIKLTMQGHVPHVEVNLNGKITRSLVLDSGAGVVALTADLAKMLNMTPGPNDPVVQLQMADGKVVEARQMTLKSVRVGQFVVENVECAVLPESLVAADNLLGGTFLKHFVYKLDPEAGELHLNQISGDTKAAGNPPAAAGGNTGGGGGSGNPFDKKK